MNGGTPEVGLGLASFVVEKSYLCRRVQILSIGQIWLEVEEARN
jgi:hypothetical protein